MNDDIDDDVPQLPADTLALLAEMRKEQERKQQDGDMNIDEDWQLSQFWYSEETARLLCEEAVDSIDGKGRIACISSPTLINYFHHMNEYKSGDIQLRLFEFDVRFGAKYPDEFVHYDYNQPLLLSIDLAASFDVLIVDPPFLADECLVKTSQTCRILMKPNARIILCTGAIMEDVAKRLLHVHRLQFRPQHANNLANDFACFTNYEPRKIQ